MTARVKVDLRAGLLEVEGTEAFVREMYNDFWATRAGTDSEVDDGKKKQTKPPKPQGEVGSKKKAKPKSSSRRDKNAGLKVVGDLDLSGKGGKESLVDMFGRLKPATNLERNLVIVHYLDQVCAVESVTTDHVYTCYHVTRDVKIPGALAQSLWDTASRHAWLDTESPGAIQVTTHGINHIEHTMAKRAE